MISTELLALLQAGNQHSSSNNDVTIVRAIENRINKRIKVNPLNAILYDVISMDPNCGWMACIKTTNVNASEKNSSRFIGGTDATSRENEGDDNNNNNEKENSGATLTPQGQSESSE